MDEPIQNELIDADANMSDILRGHRYQARQFMSQSSSSAAALEAQLVQQLESTLNELEAAASNDGSVEEETQRRQAELAELERRLAEQEQELAARETRVQEQASGTQDAQTRLNERMDHLQSLLDDLEQRRADTHEAETKLNALKGEQQSALESINLQRTELQQLQQRLETQSNELASREKAVESREKEIDESRYKLARELKFRRKEQLAEIESQRSELEKAAARDDAEIESRIAEFQDELSRLQKQTEAGQQQSTELRAQLEAAHAQVAQQEAVNRDLLQRLEEIASTDNRNTIEAAELTAELAEAREKAESRYAASEATLKQSRQEQEQLRQELTEAAEQLSEANQQIQTLQEDAASLRDQVSAAGDESSQERIRELEEERNALLERLADTEKMSSAGANNEQLEELQNRYEMAISEIRELKLINAKHEEQAAAAGGAVVGQAMDWEAQKSRMLAQLEADVDEDDPDRAADRLTIEGAIQMTDQAVAEKEKEIEELRRLLSDQSQNLGGVAVGAAAIADMLDTDELVKQEREKLEALQLEWREKLRKAEIDISVERAKIARERAQLEERLETLENRTISDEDNASKADEPKRGKWLARLGLKDGN